MKVPTDRIRVLDGQNRDNSDKSIIASIEKEGVLVPLLVYNAPDGEDFILVAGHRRLASAIHFGIPEVPVVIIPQDQAERARALENLDRKGLHPLDEANEIRTLQAQGYDNGLISAMMGIELPRVIRRSKLNNLDPKAKQSFLEGKINAEEAEELSVMDQDSQRGLLPTIEFGNFGVKQIRSMYLARQGLKLDGVADKLLCQEPQCAKCPHNLAAEDPLLFPGTMGNCKDPKCYANKLRQLMKDEGFDNVVVNKDDNDLESFCKAMKAEKIRVRKVSGMMLWNNGQFGEKVLTIRGNIAREVRQDKPKQNPKDKERIKEIEKLYKEKSASMMEELNAMIAEFADAWMAKNHKGEPLPDKDERVILAKALVKADTYNLRGFLYGSRYHASAPILQGADNRRIFGVIMLYCTHKSTTGIEFEPHDLGWYKDFRLPDTLEIEDEFQLKTSKHKKKAQELGDELKKLYEEHKKLKGK